MKRLSKERENRYKRIYFKSFCTSVNDYYKPCSYYKKRAEERILNEMVRNNGYRYRILCANPFAFTCAYMMKDNENDKYLLIVHC